MAASRVAHDGLPIDAPWIHGQRRGSPNHDPVLQVRTLDPTTYVIRQSKTVTYEAPFLYLLVGAERALLLDTGAVRSAGVCPVRRCVDDLLPAGPPLVVAHTHGHGDHASGDEQFAGRPATTVVSHELAAFAAERPVSQVLGCHIELAHNGREYPTGTRYQPDEAPLPLSVRDLMTIRDGVRAAAGRSGVHDVGPARVWNGPCYGAQARQAAQLACRQLLGIR